MVESKKFSDIGPVLITGCSSGIGRYVSLYLAEQGVKVYATARNLADLDWITSLPKETADNLIRLQLDVTDLNTITTVRNFIEKMRLGLFAIINNAGVGDLGFHSSFSESEMFDIFNVNVFGPWRVTNSFLTLIIESKGRVINIGSQGGIITKKLYGPYSMTKFALEAYSESLQTEISPFGSHVGIIQPGGIVSEIGSNSLDRFISRLERAEPPFTKEAKTILEVIRNENNLDQFPINNEPESETNRKPSSPAIVAEAVSDALLSPTPKRRYLVGTKWEGNRVIKALIQKLIDENNNPKHNYSLSDLCTLLEAQYNKMNEK